MKHTIAQNRMLFNVKEIASNVKIEDLKDGQFGVFAVDSDTSIADTTTFEDLPEEFHIVSKLNGEVYYSFSTIKKKDMLNFNKLKYKESKPNIWEGELSCCSCIETATLKVYLDEDELMRDRGISWTAVEGYFASAPTVLTCSCVCSDGDKKHLSNHYMTLEIYKQVKAAESTYYDIEVLTSEGEVLDGVEKIKKHIEDNKDNENAKPLKIRLIGKEIPGTYIGCNGDFNYIYPRGVRIEPSVNINDGECTNMFKEVQELEYELNTGFDLRSEEWDAIDYYTGINGFRQLADGTRLPINYQFENEKKYNTVNFEYYTKKVNRNDGDMRSFGILLGTEKTEIFDKIVKMFIPEENR